MVSAKQKSKLGGRGEAGQIKSLTCIQFKFKQVRSNQIQIKFKQVRSNLKIHSILNLFLIHFITELASSCSKGEGEEAGGGATGEVGQASGGAEEAQVTPHFLSHLVFT